MRKFNQIYAELKHYSAFTPNPANQEQTTKALNAFLSELAQDDDQDPVDGFAKLSKTYSSYPLAYMQSAQRAVSFKDWLQGIYGHYRYNNGRKA